MNRSVDEIAVGIPTFGQPKLVPVGPGLTRLENMLIGKDFHWQKSLEVLLPGRIEVISKGDSGKVIPGSNSEDNFSVIDHVPLETYLECVVGSEMNPAAPLEFLKAHAIISRSWAVGKVLGCHPEDDEGRRDDSNVLIGWDDTATHKYFHVCSDDHCQRFQGIQPVSRKAKEAIDSTAGTVLIDTSGNILDARFSKCCGGVTEVFSTCWQDREMPGLESVHDPWCDLSMLPEEKRMKVLKGVLKDYDLSTCGGFSWETEVLKSEIEKNLLKKFNRKVGKIISLHPVRRGPSGRISSLRIEGDAGELLLGKELWIRRLLSPTHLYSSSFEISNLGDRVRLKGRGWGHGVGLCQIGAARMALEGATCEEILKHYYPSASIGKIS